MSSLKELVAKKISERVKDRMILGIGSGTTVNEAIKQIGQRIKKENLIIFAYSASSATSYLAEENGINILDPFTNKKIDFAFDGADEVDPELNLIKGAGGALLQEKILAEKAGSLTIIVDESKLVKALGERCLLPIEVVPNAVLLVQKKLENYGAFNIALRKNEKNYPFITDNGNYLIDANFKILNRDIGEKLKNLVGVVDTGLFFDVTNEVLVSRKDGSIESIFPKESK